MKPDIRTLLGLAARLVTEAEDAGIAVATVSVSADRRIHIHAADEHLTATLAAALGLTRRSEYEGATGRRTEVFAAEIDGTTVLTSGPVPPSPEDRCATCGRPLGERAGGHSPDMAVVVDEDTGERLTRPLARELAQRVVDVTTERRVRVEAVAR